MTKADVEHAEWEYEQKKRDAERAHDQDEEYWHKTTEAAVSSGLLAVRTAVIINGGAAVSVLTFISSLIENGKLPAGLSLGQITSPLIWFAWGVAIATAAMGFGYLVNYSNAAIISSRTRTYEHPYIVETNATRWWRRSSNTFTVLSILSAIVSLGLFIYGMIAVRNAITALQ